MDPLVTEWSRYILRALVILSLLLSLCSIKWHAIANLFYYLELCIRLCAVLIPNEANEQHTAIYLTMLSLILFIALYCGKLSHLVLATLHLAFAIFFGVHAVY